MRSRASLISLLLVVGVAGPVAGQDVERVRALYIAAAYEEALAVMPPPNDAAPLTTDLEQYRALCLLALGREGDAAAAVERLVRGNPMYVPSGDLTPRMLAMFSDTRAKLLPDLAKQTYADAKTAFDAKEHEAARVGFQRTVHLIDSLGVEDQTSLADLRLLASGFLDLTPVAPPAPPPPPVAAPATTAPEPAAAYVPPVAISERLPLWAPPDSAAKRNEYTGLLRIEIGEDGRVVNATVVDVSHPAYDMAVLRAAKLWTYKPATRGGRPVTSQKDIQIRLVPR